MVLGLKNITFSLYLLAPLEKGVDILKNILTSNKNLRMYLAQLIFSEFKDFFIEIVYSHQISWSHLCCHKKGKDHVAYIMFSIILWIYEEDILTPPPSWYVPAPGIAVHLSLLSRSDFCCLRKGRDQLACIIFPIIVCI